MYLRRLSARVVCVVLNQAFDLPRRHPKPCQGAREVLRRHVDKCDVTPGCLGYRLCNLCVRNCRWPSNCVCLAKVSRLSQHGRSDKGNVTNIDSADACVADRGEEPPLIDDRRLECQEALKVEIWPEERIADAKLADPSLDSCRPDRDTSLLQEP